ncbi:MAG: LLM class flavin-dependent oxidoreductase [Betaproteobacteria bacterium]|nr:LLM class flavin-dependent oxidoreductase [Betaproteobacteria bacterium]
MPLNFDLFYEIAMPPQLGRSEPQAYADVLDEIALAETLGYRCAWLVEHHFMRGYSHSSKPELVLAALARCTRRIRLGHAVIPLPLHHPVHVAERVATLDVLSGGRLEIGIGRGFSPREFTVFGSDIAASRELVDESLEILRRSFERGPVTYHGRHYRLEAIDIVPRAVQQPHPPLWAAAVSPDTYPWAAVRGLGVLAGPFKPWFMVKHDLGRYRAAWRAPGVAPIGMTLGVLCLADGKRARSLGQQAFTWFYRELFKTTLPVLERLYPSYEQLHELGRFRQLMKLGIDLGLADFAGLAVVGDPAECIAKLRKYADAGVTNVMCAFGAGAVPSAIVRESMALFAREVMPAFAATGDGQNSTASFAQEPRAPIPSPEP